MFSNVIRYNGIIMYYNYIIFEMQLLFVKFFID